MVLRPIFCEKLKIAPPHKKTSPSNVWISDLGRKISPNFGEDLFFIFYFLETTWFWAEKIFEFPSFPRNFVSIYGQIVWNWFKNNENSGQGRLHFSHSFKIAPPLFQILAMRLHKYYSALHEHNVKIFASFLLWLFWSFSFLAGVVSKIFANKNTFATNHNGN